MAKLSHPNVVSVYDVEIENETVVIAMEYVDGATLMDWLDRQPRTWQEILALFVGAGRGLEAAHQAGVLHRDFKPGNVLVTSDDRAKVTDFGLARLEEARARTAPSHDEVGAPEVPERKLPKSEVLRIHLSTLPPTAPLTDGQTVKGTPAYMAPEQHESAVLTPAVDQYAFCVSLWQALTGEVPFPVGKLSMARLLEAKQAGPPPWPKHVELPRVGIEALLRGLQPAAADRWPSMTELLAALEMDSRRQRRALIGGIAGATLLAASATALIAWQQHRAALCGGAGAQLADVWDADRRGRAEAAVLATELGYAPEVWQRVGPALDRYAEQWITTHTQVCEATALRGEQSTQLMDLRMSCLRKAKVELAATTSALVDADSKTVEKAHALVAALPKLERCDDVEALQAEVPPPESEADREAVRAIEATLATARTQLEIGRYDAGLAEIQRVGDSVAQLDYGPIHTSWSLAKGDAHEGLGDYPAAEKAHVDALRSALQWRQWGLASRAARELTFEVGAILNRHAEGLAYAQTAFGLARGLGPTSEAATKSALASVYNAEGKPSAAETELREALALWDAAPDAEPLGAASARSNLAVVLASQGDFENAEHELRTALAVYEHELGTEHPNVASVRNNLSLVLRSRGDNVGAEAEQRRVIVLYESALGPDHPSVARSRGNLAVTLEISGRYAEAEAETRRAIAVYEATLGPEHAEVAAAYSNLSNTLRLQEQLAEAETTTRRALEIWGKALPADHPNVAHGWHGLGRVLMDQRRFGEAAESFERAHRMRESGEVPPTLRADSSAWLARALWPVKAERPRARKLRAAALEIFRADGPSSDEARRELEAWMADAP
jgi:tetratricopeptide (TPR) repeat protein